jgi:hypothetical protein
MREADEEEALMQTFILAHRSETPEAMLATVLRAARLRDYPALGGRSYRVHIRDGRFADTGHKFHPPNGGLYVATGSYYRPCRIPVHPSKIQRFHSTRRACTFLIRLQFASVSKETNMRHQTKHYGWVVGLFVALPLSVLAGSTTPQSGSNGNFVGLT